MKLTSSFTRPTNQCFNNLSVVSLLVLEKKKKNLKQLMHFLIMWLCFYGSSDGKESACNEGDPGSTPESGRSPGEGNGNTLQYSCLENSMDRPWGRKELDMTEQLPPSLTHMLMNQIASIHWIIEKAREFQKNVYLCFIDYT